MVRRIDQVSARTALPTCTDPVVKDVLGRVARAKEVYTVKEVDSDGLDGRRWCYASFSAPYPGPNGSDPGSLLHAGVERWRQRSVVASD